MTITIWVKFHIAFFIHNKCHLKQLKIERRANAKKTNTPPFPHEARLIIVGARSTWKYAFNSPYIHICLATYLLSVFLFNAFRLCFPPLLSYEAIPNIREFMQELRGKTCGPLKGTIPTEKSKTHRQTDPQTDRPTQTDPQTDRPKMKAQIHTQHGSIRDTPLVPKGTVAHL